MIDDDTDLLIEIENTFDDFDEIIEKKPRRGRKPKNEDKETEEYVNKDEMWQEIYDYYIRLGDNYDWNKQEVIDKNDTSVPLSNKISTMISEIATRIGYRPNFLNYSFKSEMIGDAQLKMVKALRDGSFKCFHTAEIIDEIIKDGEHILYFYDRKGKLKNRKREEHDIFFEKNGKRYMTYRRSPFSYYSHISFNSFLNRIKKEKLANSTKLDYQEQVWENVLASEQWQGVRRPKHMDSDENEELYD